MLTAFSKKNDGGNEFPPHFFNLFYAVCKAEALEAMRRKQHKVRQKF